MIIHLLEVLVYNYEALFDITFLKINTHKVTQDSTGFNSGNRLNPILISAFFLAHFVDKKKLPLKSHGKTIINILNYLQSKH